VFVKYDHETDKAMRECNWDSNYMPEVYRNSFAFPVVMKTQYSNLLHILLHLYIVKVQLQWMKNEKISM
jgi:hypothetical protein